MNIQQLKTAEAKVLKNPQDHEALSFILNQLNDPRVVYRSNAAAVLGELGGKVGASIKDLTAPALSRFFDKGDSYDKSAVVRAFAKFGRSAEGAIRGLQKNLVPSDRDVAWFLAEALGNIGEGAAEAAPDLLDAIKKNVDKCEGYFSDFCGSFIPALGAIGPPAKSAVPDLEALLDHKDPYVRMRLAVAIQRISPGNREAVRTLEGLLKNADPEVRRRTLESLEECGKDAEPLKQVIKASLSDSDEDVRVAASGLLRILNGN